MPPQRTHAQLRPGPMHSLQPDPLQKPTAPVMFINAYDDPVFHGSFTFQHEKFAEVNPNAVFVQVNKGLSRAAARPARGICV